MFTTLAFLIALTPGSGTPTFEAFAVPKPIPFVAVKPDVRRGESRRYRTVLREAANEAPDFAGHFKIVGWGCGTCCSEFAILNLKIGRAFFPGFAVACEFPIESFGIDFEYRVDSRLLVITGAPNESTPGVRYFEWTGTRLKLLKFVRIAVAANSSLHRTRTRTFIQRERYTFRRAGPRR